MAEQEAREKYQNTLRERKAPVGLRAPASPSSLGPEIKQGRAHPRGSVRKGFRGGMRYKGVLMNKTKRPICNSYCVEIFAIAIRKEKSTRGLKTEEEGESYKWMVSPASPHRVCREAFHSLFVLDYSWWSQSLECDLHTAKRAPSPERTPKEEEGGCSTQSTVYSCRGPWKREAIVTLFPAVRDK